MKKVILSLLFLSILVFANTANAATNTVPSATVYYNQGIDYYNSNEIQNSINAFKKAIEINPKFY